MTQKDSFQQTRVPSVPLITCDPYFSVWSPADTLYGADTCHWTGRTQRVTGVVTIDGATYRFMGLGAEHDPTETLTQTALEISATSSLYRFAGQGIELEVSFMTPLLLSKLDLVSRPVSYIGVKVRGAEGKDARVRFSFDAAHCRRSDTPAPMISGVHRLERCRAAWLGQRKQAPLSHSGDNVTIDWGYLYLAVPEGQGDVAALEHGAGLYAELSARDSFIAVAYDDLASINYFGEIRRGYWARDGKTIVTAIEEAMAEYAALRGECGAFDRELGQRAENAGGADYRRVVALAYRQSIAAHKLITDEHGDVVFISKECFSNGCAATVDISYPSSPLYLLYNPELLKGMLRPILRFARLPVWTDDFAPHDAGRYPYVTGQVYALREHVGSDEIYPPYYMFPAGTAETTFPYDPRYQMPVEECGNMLIMLAAVGDAAFAAPYMDTLEKWAAYLLKHGANPGEQLCTDDFAGHLAGNCNLAAKAIMGIQAYAMLLRATGDADKARFYGERAKTMAADWQRNASHGDHTALVFGEAEGWSLKYNLVWDRVFRSGLFEETLYENEVAWYLRQQRVYGVPLDSRKDYTKSDWLLWVSAFTSDKRQRETLIAPVVAFLEQTEQRVPFSDWYDTVTARPCGFQNRTVQGGLFMPLLLDQVEGK